MLTVDFFTPIVDDPFDFGRIAAANSLSDIYAMGGVPLTALNLLAFSCALGPEVVAEVLRGAAEVCRQAGVVVVGGHTIDDAEPKFGLSVMGTVHPDKVWYNKGAQPKDVLILTKPLGTGVWGTAIKRGLVLDIEADPTPEDSPRAENGDRAQELSSEQARVVIEAMATLNRKAAEAAEGLDVHAVTDVTGFGLAGHVHEMAQASGVDAKIALDVVPLHDGVKALVEQGVVPGRTADHIDWSAPFISFDETYSADEQALWLKIVCDPQTSGGLLLALPREDAGVYLQRMGSSAVAIGTCIAGDGCITFV